MRYMLFLLLGLLTSGSLFATIPYNDESNSNNFIKSPSTLVKHQNLDQLSVSGDGDPLLYQQWSFWDTKANLIEAQKNFSKVPTEHIAPVIAVIDDGIQNHEDLQHKFSKNAGEIPANGIDDDHNGLIDDHSGWNFNTATNKTTLGSHGTQMAGIIAAEADNEIGISGICSDCEILPIVVNTTSFDMVQFERALAYLYQQKKDFDRSNGEKGQNIRVINISWGVPLEDIASSHQSKALIDDLGKLGVLTVCSASNTSSPSQFDFPSSLESDYIIRVGGYDVHNTIIGHHEADVFAPAADILSTTLENGYQRLTGTSLAAAHISGLLGLASASHPKEDALTIGEKLLEHTVALNHQGQSINKGWNPLDFSRSLLECERPTGLNIKEAVKADTLFFSLEDSLAYVDLWYKWQENDEWTKIDSIQNGYPLPRGIFDCDTYELFVTNNCDEENSNSDTLVYDRIACNVCLQDTLYCLPTPVDSTSNEYIFKSIQIEDKLIYVANNAKYQQRNSRRDTVIQGQYLDLKIFPQDSKPFKAGVWVDSNHKDGFEAMELLNDDKATHQDSAVLRVFLPESAVTGVTRMRIGMFPADSTVQVCQQGGDQGSYLDQCVFIEENPLVCQNVMNLDTMMLTRISVDFHWCEQDSSIAYIYRYRVQGDKWKDEMVDTSNVLSLTGLLPCTPYEFQVKSICTLDTSNYSESFTFNTVCLSPVEDPLLDLNIGLYPNPTNDVITLSLENEHTTHKQMNLSVYNIQGRQVHSESIKVKDHLNHVIPSSQWAAGVYYIRLSNNTGSAMLKFIKTE